MEKQGYKIQFNVLYITGTTAVIQLLYETHSIHRWRKIEGHSKTEEKLMKFIHKSVLKY